MKLRLLTICFVLAVTLASALAGPKKLAHEVEVPAFEPSFLDPALKGDQRDNADFLALINGVRPFRGFNEAQLYLNVTFARIHQQGYVQAIAQFDNCPTDTRFAQRAVYHFARAWHYMHPEWYPSLFDVSPERIDPGVAEMVVLAIKNAEVEFSSNNSPNVRSIWEVGPRMLHCEFDLVADTNANPHDTWWPLKQMTEPGVRINFQTQNRKGNIVNYWVVHYSFRTGFDPLSEELLQVLKVKSPEQFIAGILPDMRELVKIDNRQWIRRVDEHHFAIE